MVSEEEKSVKSAQAVVLGDG